MRVGDANRVAKCGCGFGDRYRKIPPATGRSHNLERQTHARGWKEREEGGDNADSVVVNARCTFGENFTRTGRDNTGKNDLNRFQ